MFGSSRPSSPVFELLKAVLRTMNVPRDYGSVIYRKLNTKTDDFVAQQFEQKPPNIPWRAISFALVLFVLGTGLLTTSILLLTGLVDNGELHDRPISLAILGFLMFLPGAYHVRIAYYALLGHPSYSFDDIPEFQ